MIIILMRTIRFFIVVVCAVKSLLGIDSFFQY